MAGMHFIFLKNVTDQASKPFNTKIGRQWKDRESSYQDKSQYFFATQVGQSWVKIVLKALKLKKSTNNSRLKQPWVS